MTYTINPVDYGLIGKGRLQYYDIKKGKYIKRHMLDSNEIVEISNTGILKNVLNFKFRFQKYENGRWINISEFFYLEKARYVRQFFLDKFQMSDDEIINMIHFFSNDYRNMNYSLAVTSFKR